MNKIKTYCLLWTDFTTSPNVFIVDFEQVSIGWEAKGRYTKQDILIFLLKLVFAFLLHLHLPKISNGKATVTKETIGFDVWTATILSYIKHVAQQDSLFCGLQMTFKNWTVVIKLNEISVWSFVL